MEPAEIYELLRIIFGRRSDAQIAAAGSDASTARAHEFVEPLPVH